MTDTPAAPTAPAVGAAWSPQLGSDALTRERVLD